eukprot:1714791-Amphidinium_carterae.1
MCIRDRVCTLAYSWAPFIPSLESSPKESAFHILRTVEQHFILVNHTKPERDVNEAGISVRARTKISSLDAAAAFSTLALGDEMSLMFAAFPSLLSL